MWTDNEVESLWTHLVANVDTACRALKKFDEGSRERSYLLTYQPIVSLFEQLLNEKDHHTGAKFSLLASVVWAWMPTALRIRGDNQNEGLAYEALIDARIQPELIGVEQLVTLRDTFTTDARGATLAGPSKMLHFTNPRKFAIWDSNIIDKLNNIVDRNDIGDRNDAGYLEYCSNFLGTPDYREAQVVGPINDTLRKLNYDGDVSLVRAVDIVLFNVK